MNTYLGRRVETECGATYVPVDPKTELPEYIVDAAWSRDGTAEDAEAVRNWIEETQNINATYTHWHPRIPRGQTLLFHLTHGSITAIKLDLVRLLIARGADVNIRDSEGQSPLHNATYSYYETSPVLVSLLLDAGATDLNTRTCYNTKTLGHVIGSSFKCPEVALKVARILLRAGASLDRVYNEKSAEQYLAKGERMKPHLARDEHFRTLKNLVHGTRTRRAIARLRSYAIRGRVTAEVRLLDDGALAALARVKLYNSLFGLPHVLFKEVVSKL